MAGLRSLSPLPGGAGARGRGESHCRCGEIFPPPALRAALPRKRERCRSRGHVEILSNTLGEEMLLRILDRLEEIIIASLMAAATILIFVSVVHRFATARPFPSPL